VMFFLRYHVAPAVDHPERDRLGEAYCCCWLDRRTLAAADKAARRDIRGQRWQVLDRECGDEVTAADYDTNPEWLGYYQQAVTDKEVFVYYRSPRHPVYWVTAAVECGTTAAVADAHYFLFGGSVELAGEDVYDPAFWTGEHLRAALDGAREAIAHAGWVVTAFREHRPCAYADVPEELAAYYDEAEESGCCLVFVREAGPEGDRS
jgi:hypothetical protein